MRRLALLTLVALAAFPLSAHDHWRGPRRMVVVETPHYAPHHTWEERRWDDRDEDRWDRHEWYGRYHRHDFEEDHLVFRPLPRPLNPPFVGRVEFRFH